MVCQQMNPSLLIGPNMLLQWTFKLFCAILPAKEIERCKRGERSLTYNYQKAGNVTLKRNTGK